MGHHWFHGSCAASADETGPYLLLLFVSSFVSFAASSVGTFALSRPGLASFARRATPNIILSDIFSGIGGMCCCLIWYYYPILDVCDPKEWSRSSASKAAGICWMVGCFGFGSSTAWIFIAAVCLHRGTRMRNLHFRGTDIELVYVHMTCWSTGCFVMMSWYVAVSFTALACRTELALTVLHLY